MQVIIRPYKDADKSFIYSTFLRGLYYGNPFYGAINKTAFFANYPKVLDHILDKPETELKIACLADDEDIIIGYAIIEKHVLHYIGVKEAWRMQGIARKLLAGSEIRIATHSTKPGAAIIKKKGWELNPWKI